MRKKYTIFIIEKATGEFLAKLIRKTHDVLGNHPKSTNSSASPNAGFAAQQIAPLFGLAYNLPNVFLPKEFWEVLG